MKKFAAFILILSMMTGCLMTGCDNSNSRSRRRDSDREEEEEDDDEDEEEETSSRETLPQGPQHNLSYVDESFSFDDFYAEPVDMPWVLENNIPFTTSPVINTYYSLYLVSGYSGNYSEIDTTNLNTVATITRPVVRHYPSDTPGYTIYEVQYTETFPHRIIMPTGSNGGLMWRYHGVEFLDYYTGTMYPVINMSSDIDSFRVSGDVYYNNEQYSVNYYEFRDCEEAEDSISTDSNGNTVWETTYIEHHTAYFEVPNGYDGIVMCVYVADDSDTGFAEAMAEDSPYFTPPEQFDGPESDRNIDDYVFISIAELG